MDAFGLPKGTDEEKKARKAAIEEASKYAIQIPFRVMEKSLESMQVMKAMAETGMAASASDVGVGALCARTAVMGAYLNVKINAAGLDDKVFAEEMVRKGEEIAEAARTGGGDTGGCGEENQEELTRYFDTKLQVNMQLLRYLRVRPSFASRL